MYAANYVLFHVFLFEIMISNVLSTENGIFFDYGLTVVVGPTSVLFICYKRLSIADEDESWITKIDMHSGYCFYNEGKYYCMETAIDACKWNSVQTYNVAVFTYLKLPFIHERHLAASLLNIDCEPPKNRENIKTFRHSPMQISVDTSALMDLLKYHYNADTNFLDPSPFMSITGDKFVIAFLTNKPALYDDWMIMTFLIRNKKYTAVVFDLYCLSVEKIRWTSHEIFFKKMNSDNIISYPCSINNHKYTKEWIRPYDCCSGSTFSDAKIQFKVNYDLDECVKLIHSVFEAKHKCGENYHCNLSNLKQALFEQEFSKLKIYNEYFTFDMQRNGDLRTALQKYRVHNCVYTPEPRVLSQIWEMCHHLDVIHALLSYQPLFSGKLLVSLAEIRHFLYPLNMEYLFLDFQYIVLFPREEDHKNIEQISPFISDGSSITTESVFTEESPTTTEFSLTLESSITTESVFTEESPTTTEFSLTEDSFIITESLSDEGGIITIKQSIIKVTLAMIRKNTHFKTVVGTLSCFIAITMSSVMLVAYLIHRKNHESQLTKNL